MTLANWKSFRLDELCEVRIGRTPRCDNPAYWGGDAVWVTIRELDGGVISSSKEHVSDLAVETVMPEPVPEGTLLFSFKLSIGKMGIAGCPLYTNEAIAALPIRDPDRLSRDFLRYALMATSHEGGANNAVLGKVLNKEKVSAIRVPLPPLDEQHRIARILDEAEGLRQLRARADERMADFIPALFNQMFGDPATNPKGWNSVTLGQLLSFITSGSRGWAQYYASAGAQFIRVQNLTGHRLSFDDVAHVKPPETSETKRTRIMPHDLLLAITGATIGLSALAPEDIGEAYVNQHVAILRLNSDVDPAYAAAFMVDKRGGQRQIAKMQYGHTKPGIGLEQIRSMTMSLPPLALQREFAARVTEARAVQDQQARSRSRLEAGFQALLHRAFEGEL